MNRKVVVFLSLVYRPFLGQWGYSDRALHQLKSYLGHSEETIAQYDLRSILVPSRALMHEHFFGEYYCRVLADVVALKPSVICLSLQAWCMPELQMIGTWIRAHLPTVVLVAGGPEVADREEFVGDCSLFDILVEGEGEGALKEILRTLAVGRQEFPGLAGVSWRVDGGYQHNPGRAINAESDSQLYSFENDINRNQGSELLHLTRGCVYNCSYCAGGQHSLSKTDQRVIRAELQAILARKSSLVRFQDYDIIECLEKDPSAWDTVLEPLKNATDVKLGFSASPRSLTSSWLRRLAEESRLRVVTLSIQSLNPEALRAVRRGWSVPFLPLLDTAVSRFGDVFEVELIFPLPFETSESFVAGLDRLIAAGFVNFTIHPLRLFRGTELRRRAEELGLKWFRTVNDLVYETPHMSAVQRSLVGGVGAVLDSLARFVGRFPELAGRIREMWTVRTGVASELHRRIVAGETVDEVFLSILEDLRTHVGTDWTMPDIYPPRNEAFWLQGQPLLPHVLLNEPLAPPWRPVQQEPKPESAQSDESVLRGRYPGWEEIRKEISGRGFAVGSDHMEGSRLLVAVQTAEGSGEIELSPRSDPGRAFREVGPYKVSYRGHPSVASAAEALVAWLSKETRDNLLTL